MKALTVLYGGRLASPAFEAVFEGKSAFSLALERARAFPGTEKTVLLGREGEEYPDLAGVEVVRRPNWTVKSLLETLGGLSSGYDLCYYAWADCPLLDPRLAEALAARHLRYRAEYSYADGWPYGLSPELLAPSTPAILANLVAADETGVERNSLFEAVQKDINAFDIETEISAVDLRSYRLCLAADSHRNLLLLKNLAAAGLCGADDAEAVIRGNPALLRTLPAFFPVQAAVPCPQSCSLCPYPRFKREGINPGGLKSGESDFMALDDFEKILEKISAFAGDGVIGLSLWGELSLHPDAVSLIAAVLKRRELSLLIETSGLGWNAGAFSAIAEEVARACPRLNNMPPLSWIVSLDAHNPERYREVRGPGYAEAVECAEKLAGLFPGGLYVQALRVKDSEDDMEAFYRYWKENKKFEVIIQKYDSFGNFLPDLKTADLSPLHRQPCWHLMRDMPVLLDGTVPLCREDIRCGGVLGNILTDDMEEIWLRGAECYKAHTEKNYGGICANCDEYYTYNF